MQTARLQAEIFAPPVGAGHFLAVQRRERGVERLQHGQRGHVDASDGQADGVPTEVVGQGLDLGQFGHESSVPVRRE